MTLIPDRSRPLLGIRQFFLTERGVIVSPNRKGYTWDAGWKRAECSPGRYFKRLGRPHNSPHPDCVCGILLGYSLDTLWREGTIKGNVRNLAVRNAGQKTKWDLGGEGYCVVFYALVAAGGDIRKFENLMKVERAKIFSIVMPPAQYIEGPTIEPRDAEFLALSYGIGYMDLRSAPDITTKEMRAMAPIFNTEYWAPGDAPLNFSAQGEQKSESERR